MLVDRGKDGGAAWGLELEVATVPLVGDYIVGVFARWSEKRRRIERRMKGKVKQRTFMPSGGEDADALKRIVPNYIPTAGEAIILLHLTN